MIERIAFVSAPGSSAFMGELLDVVADAVDDVGFPTVRHIGAVAEVDDGCTAFVLIPHEYFAVAGPPSASARLRTIGFCVEHPGAATYEASAHAAAELAMRFDINEHARAESRRRGISSQRFELGYSRGWDRRAQAGPRDIDVLYLGTADPRRLALLADLAPGLYRAHTELYIPPHEPMTRSRPDFLVGEQKWAVLARSRTLLNLHREASTAFEWVRGLEAICNGAVVVTEQSTDLAPLVPGEDVLVASASNLATVLDAALRDGGLLESIAARALGKAQQLLDMPGSARRLVDAAVSLPASSRRVPRAAPAPRPAVDPPLAVWVPTVRALPAPPPAPDPATAFVRSLLVRVDETPSVPDVIARPSASARLDVVCVSRPGDGPLAVTLLSLAHDTLPLDHIAVHVALDGSDVSDVTAYSQVRTVIRHEYPVGRGRCRNQLLASASAPLVLVLDSGDEVRPETLRRLCDRLANDPSLDLAYSMARTDPAGLVNALIPEPRRLQRFSYLTRGYVVRRRWLDDLGGYAADMALQDLADHDFWVRSARGGVRAELLREIGTYLWPQQRLEGTDQREWDAAETLAWRERAGVVSLSTPAEPEPELVALPEAVLTIAGTEAPGDPADLPELWRAAAEPYGVCPTIHPDDLLWRFLAEHPDYPTATEAAQAYFSDGAQSARKLARILAEHAPGQPGRRVRVLEFASGYGMVTRHLPGALPEADVVSCDIHPAAMQFIGRELGVTAVQSAHLPEDVAFGGDFDVVFALSFFSHMPASTYGRWLAALYRAVRPGGVLAFTAHGHASEAPFGHPEIGPDGFWFAPSSEQSDLDGAEYGSAISTPPYVVATLFAHVGAPLAELREAHWWGHQDLYLAAKPRQ